VGNLSLLISTSVFFLAFAYAATSASIFFLRRKGVRAQFNLRGSTLIAGLGVIFSLYLITQCSLTQIALGLALLLVGVPIYTKYSPKKEMTELKKALVSQESFLKRTYAQENRFLAHALEHVNRFCRRNFGDEQGENVTGAHGNKTD
jgi:APA family basic amino acid/polyamine antiporter